MSVFLLQASAFTMTGQQYNLEIDPEKNATPLPTPTLPPEVPQPPPSVVRQVYGELILHLSNNIIDFGPLSPTNPITRTTTISTFGKDLDRYHVMSFEDSVLHSNDDTIPNSTCDDGTCTSLHASPWISTLTYGFGYRCDFSNRMPCLTEFAQPDSFQQFANQEHHDPPHSMTTELSGENQLQMTTKVNIPGTQQKGRYTNTVTVLAVPTL